MLSNLHEREISVRTWLKRFIAKFNRIERGIVGVLILAIVVSSVQLVYATRNSTQAAAAQGGVHIEGVVGNPRFINPVLSGTNQVDVDITRLVYSGLVKVTGGREVVPDLATGWTIGDQGKSYVFNLRDNVKWHDGQPFSADDVVYTVNVLQNADYNGVLKADFEGITVEKLDTYAVKFSLPAPSSFFLYNMSIGIIPEHIFREIPVRDFQGQYKPAEIIGTGPFAYDNGISNESITLRRNKDFYDKQPYLDKIVFYFFDNQRSLQTALRNRTISAAGITDSGIAASVGDNRFVYRLPQYQAVYFNQLGDNAALKEKAVRQALAFAVDKQEIITQVENNNADRVDSPILPGFWGNKPNIKTYNFDLAAAAKLLKDAGWRDVDGDQILEKDGVRLAFTLKTRKDSKLDAISKLLLHNWKILGVEVAVEEIETANFIKDVVRPRNYQALLFGQDLGGSSDPYVYWHSSQITDPGLALAPVVDKDIDNNLEAARLTSELNQSIAPYHRFQDAFAELMPAILLYTPRYTYIVDSKLKGVTDQINLSQLSDRFANIDQWYIRTTRTETPAATSEQPAEEQK